MPKLKDLKLEDISHQKLLLRIIDIVINAKIFYNEFTDSDIKQYKEIRNLIRGQGRQRELDADTKAIQQIECVENPKITDGVNADGTKSMFVLTIF